MAQTKTAEITLALSETTLAALQARALAESSDPSGVAASAIKAYLQTPITRARSSYGDGRLFLRGRTYWTAIWAPTPSGQWREVRESTRKTSESDARRILADRIRMVRNHREGINTFVGPSQERITVNELLDALLADYQTRNIKSFKQCASHMKPVRASFRDRKAMSVTPHVVRGYIEARKTQGRSNAKINREVELLNAAFFLAVREGRLSRKPHVPRLRERNARQGFFERDEFDRVLIHLTSPTDDMARFAYVSGWRREEIRTLRWESADRQAREISLFDTKNGEGRVLPLDEEGWKLFEKLWERRRFRRRDGTEAVSEFVFHRKGRPVAGSQFTREWCHARRKAELPGKLFHDLRRTAVRNLIRAGVPQAVAMAISGHKTDSMFRRYNVTSSDDKREALRRQREYLTTLTEKSNVTALRSGDSDKT